MTFPTIPTAGANTLLTTNQPTATTTHTFPSLTTLDNAAGDLLIAIIVTYQGGSVNAEFSAWGGGFTEFVDQSANSTTVQSIGAAYKFSDGTETGTFTVTSVASNRSVMFLLSVKGAHASTVPEGGAKANGTSAAADPISLDPAGWAAEDNLWIAVGVNGETSLTGSFTGITAAPANYTNYVDSGIIGGDVIGALEGAVGFRQLNAAAEDAAGFTVDTGAAGNSALLLAVRPAAEVVVLPPGPLPELPALDFLTDNSAFFPFPPWPGVAPATVPVRFGDGVDDLVRVSADASLSGLGTGAFTIAAITRKRSADAGSVFYTANSATPATSGVLLQSTTAEWRAIIDGVTQGFGPMGPPPDDIWNLAVMTKPAGTALARLHVYNYATRTWAHGNSNASLAATAAGRDSIYFCGASGSGSFFVGWTAAAAAWDGTELSDSQCETMEAALQSWADLSPDGLWRLSDDPVDDLIGGSNQAAVVGTVIVERDGLDFDFTVSVGGTAESGQTLLAVTSTATNQKVAVQGGRCTLAGAGTGTAAKVIAQAGSSLAATTATSTAVKVAPHAGQTLAALASTGLDKKVAPQAGASTAVFAGSGHGTAAIVEAQTGQALAAFTGIATEKKVAPQAGRCTLASAARGTAAKVAPQAGHSALVGTSTGIGAKKAPQAGRSALVAFGTHSGVAARQQTGVCVVAGFGRATERKIAVFKGEYFDEYLDLYHIPGWASVNVAATSVVHKVVTERGTAALVAAGSGQATRRIAHRGWCFITLGSESEVSPAYEPAYITIDAGTSAGGLDAGSTSGVVEAVTILVGQPS